jgi:hypothetical protein
VAVGEMGVHPLTVPAPTTQLVDHFALNGPDRIRVGSAYIWQWGQKKLLLPLALTRTITLRQRGHRSPARS